MDTDRFDELAQSLGAMRSRRGVLRACTVVMTIFHAWPRGESGVMARKNRKKHRKHKTTPSPSTVTCTPKCGRKQCGNDGCGGSCGSWPCNKISPSPSTSIFRVKPPSASTRQDWNHQMATKQGISRSDVGAWVLKGNPDETWDYFASTAGSSFNSDHSALVRTLQAVFDRDWASSYAWHLS